MSKKIEFYYDFSSPTAYLAHTQLKKLAEKYQAELSYEPMLLGAVHKATHNIAPGLIPAKGKYMLLQDLPRFIKRYDVPFHMNPHFPINTVSALRGTYKARELGCFDRYVDVMFDAVWVKGLKISDPDVMKTELEANGLDAESIMASITDERVKQQLKDDTEKAVKRGCFGAPIMFIGEDMFFGQDRMDFVEETLAAE